MVFTVLYALLFCGAFAGLLWCIDLWRAKHPPKQTHQ